MPQKSRTKPSGWIFGPGAYSEGEVGSDGLPYVNMQPLVDERVIGDIGRLLVAWGHYHSDLDGYTQCLIAYNGTAPKQPKEFKKLHSRFLDETAIAFSGERGLLDIVADMKIRTEKMKIIRDDFGHGVLAAEILPTGHIIHVSIKIKNRVHHRSYQPRQLRDAVREVGSIHGRVIQLGLGSKYPIHRTSSEKQLLQAIVDTGYWTPPTKKTP